MPHTAHVSHSVTFLTVLYSRESGFNLGEAITISKGLPNPRVAVTVSISLP